MGFYHAPEPGEEFGFQVFRPVPDRYDTDDPSEILDDCWALGLRHQCDTWAIAMSPDKAVVVAEAKRFRAELDQAITDLEGASRIDAEQPRVYTMRQLNQQTACVMREIGESGKPAFITNHGRLVAMIKPLRPGQASLLDHLYRDDPSVRLDHRDAAATGDHCLDEGPAHYGPADGVVESDALPLPGVF